MVTIIEQDFKGSKAQVHWSVTRANAYSDKPVILTSPSHWRYQLHLADVLDVHSYFLLLNSPTIDVGFDPFYPSNHASVKLINGLIEIPYNIDVAIVHDRYQLFSVLYGVGDSMCFPVIYVEHEMPKPGYRLDDFKIALKNAHVVFRSSVARDAWGYSEDEATVIQDGILPCNRKHEPQSSKWLIIHDHIDLTGHPLWKDIRDVGLPIELRGCNGCLGYEVSETEEATLFDMYAGYINLRTDDQCSPELLRAISYGMPVITVQNEFLSQEFGDTLNFVENADQVQDLIRNQKYKDGTDARKILKAQFSLQHFQTNWTNLIEAVKYD